MILCKVWGSNFGHTRKTKQMEFTREKKPRQLDLSGGLIPSKDKLFKITWVWKQFYLHQN